MAQRQGERTATRLTLHPAHAEQGRGVRNWSASTSPSPLRCGVDAPGSAVRPRIHHCHLAAAARGSEGARIFNRPRAIRDHNEKIAICEFPQSRTTLVARDATDLNAFIQEFGDVILKPLDGMGAARSSAFGTTIRIATSSSKRSRHGQKTIMAQRYLPQIARATSASC